MSLYKKCLSLSKIAPCSTNVIEDNILSLSFENGNRVTSPEILSSQFDNCKWLYHERVYYISDIHLEHRIVNRFKSGAFSWQIRAYIKEIVRTLLTQEIIERIKSGYNAPMIIFGGDTSTSFELSKLFYKEFIAQWSVYERQAKYSCKRKIYAVLGNHEFWDFPNINECYNTYKELFHTLGINFLENTESKAGNIMVVGGVGFAGQNENFNANSGIYMQVINRLQEIEETNKWFKIYQHAVEKAKACNSILIVISHNPISDWNINGQLDSNCVYFYGHTHRNYLYHNNESNSHVFANNQIGYKSLNVRFKEAYIYNRADPFASFEDGFYEVSSADYMRFYDYMGEHISGNGIVERQVQKGAKFYMIKRSGYYGFFLISSKSSYICAGGRIKKLSEYVSIEELYHDFDNMIRKYLKILSPYRDAQEKVADVVKSFGGSGKIHGCIVDIDWFNHIMMNPVNNSITYYYSPVFGEVEPHESLMLLLESHNKELALQYKKQLESREHGLITLTQVDNIGELVKIDVKNSVYAISNRMNQLQRLFDKKILRDWNDDLLFSDIGEKSMPSIE